MASEWGRLQELLELNRLTRGRSLTFNEVSRSSGSLVEGGGIYVMWDAVENRWVRVGETESFQWRCQEHWAWKTWLFSHIGHAMCHASARKDLISFLYMDSWKGLASEVQANLKHLYTDIKLYLGADLDSASRTSDRTPPFSRSKLNRSALRGAGRH